MNDDPEPINHTTIWTFAVGQTEYQRRIYTVFYGDYQEYDYLPRTVMSEETKAEYDAWWAWFERQQKGNKDE